MMTSQDIARNDPIRGGAEAEADAPSCRGVFPTIAKALWFLFRCYVAIILFFIVLTTFAGCEFIYLPRCTTDCTAAGGSDAYGRPAQ